MFSKRSGHTSHQTSLATDSGCRHTEFDSPSVLAYITIQSQCMTAILPWDSSRVRSPVPRESCMELMPWSNVERETVKATVGPEVTMLFIAAGRKHEQRFTLTVCGSVPPKARALRIVLWLEARRGVAKVSFREPLGQPRATSPGQLMAKAQHTRHFAPTGVKRTGANGRRQHVKHRRK